MSGQLRYQVELFEATRLVDAGGGAATGWTSFAMAWARIQRLGTATSDDRDRRTRLRRLAATIRTRDNIVAGQRLRFRSVDYEITSIEDADDRGLKITLICEEVVS